MPYPGLYRAKVAKTNGVSATIYVPQVFGEQPIIVRDSIGALPDAAVMGWVFFQAGNAEFPVWVGAQTSTGGGGGGGGVDEVWIGPDIPADPDLELWYDTDATGSGMAAVVSYVHNQTTPATVWTINHNLGWYPNVFARDSAGTNVEGDVTQVSTNTMTIAFSGAFSGVAYLS